MTLEMYYDTITHIANGFWIGKKNLLYDFGYEHSVILSGLVNFSYLSQKIIALKKDSKIFVYSFKITNQNNIIGPEKLLEFTAYSPIAYGKIVCEYNTYLIDCNCQIKYSSRAHIC